MRPNLPPLAYSTQAEGVVGGHDTWFVYFQPDCVVQVAETDAVASPECSK